MAGESFACTRDFSAIAQCHTKEKAKGPQLWLSPADCCGVLTFWMLQIILHEARPASYPGSTSSSSATPIASAVFLLSSAASMSVSSARALLRALNLLAAFSTPVGRSTTCASESYLRERLERQVTSVRTSVPAELFRFRPAG